MSAKTSNSFQIPEPYYMALFEAMSGNNVLIKADPPKMTILAATPGFLKETGYTKEAMIGKGVFEAFPVNNDPEDSGGRELLASFEHVIRHKEPHTLPAHRYDLKDTDGNFAERHWRASNKPVLSPEGEVAYIIHSTEDITGELTAQKRENRLREVEKFFALVMEAPMVVGLAMGDDYVLEMANKAAFRLWGKGPEIIGKPILEGLPELEGQGVIELFDQVRSTGQPFLAYEVPVTSYAGGQQKTHYFDLVYQPYFDECTEGVAGVFTISYDITAMVLARKKLEESEREAERTAALEQQKRFVESILEASSNGVYALKAVRNGEGVITDFRYLFANKKIASYLELDMQAIIGMSMLELIPENRDNGFFDLFCRVLETGQSHQNEDHFIARNIDKWFNYIMVPIDDDTVVTSIEDITERKRTALQMEEQRSLLENILKNSSNGISVTEMIRGRDGQVVDARTILVNDAAVKYVGLPKDVYLSKTANEIDPAVLSSPYGLTCLKTLETGEPSMSRYFLEVTGQWLELTISKMDDDHLIHIFTDITSIKETQLQSERYMEELKRSNQNLEEFAYAASHDLKEPMRKIHLFSGRLKDLLRDRLNEAEAGYFNRIMKATDRMNTLIDDLLMYSHVSMGVELFEMVDLNGKVARVMEDLEVQIEETKAVVNVGSLPTVKGHRRQLQQLFQNLIGNAIKYHKPDAVPEVHISSRRASAEDVIPVATAKPLDQYYLIEIRDNGIGFAQEDADRIFNVFTRLHGNAEYKGTGVGLSIVQKVVENHSGYIWAEGKAGEGATFRILLPVD
jgi:signal transduction histidine kinase